MELSSELIEIEEGKKRSLWESFLDKVQAACAFVPALLAGVFVRRARHSKK